jgi:DNA polymerase III epsilon subunit-like protein
MAPFLVFDTETTGVPVKNAKYTNLEGFSQSRVLSVAVVVFTEEEADNYYSLVKCPGVQVAATEIHGITQEQVDNEGVPIREVYDSIKTLFEQGFPVVGHNVKFDVAVLRSEFFRAGFDTDFMDDVNWICTHEMTKKILFTTMKLEKLYSYLFDETFDGAHNALNDCRATGRIYSHLSRDPRKYSSITAKKVWIKVSDIATIAGVSYFKKPYEIIENLWSRYNPDTFEGQTIEQLREATLNSAPGEIKELFDDAKSVSTQTSDEVQSILKKAQGVISNHPDLTKEEKTIINQHLQKTMYTNHGIKSEDDTVKDMDACYVKDENFYKLLVCKIKGTEYYICGRVDRVEMCEDGTQNLVEIKNRTKNLFNRVRDYENIQVQIYLHLNQMWKSARLIEQFNNQKKLYAIERDPPLVAKTLERVHEFCKTLHYYMSS